MVPDVDEKRILVKVGESFSLSLRSNPSTGYSWEATFDENCLKFEDRSFNPDSSLIGSGGNERFTFRPLRTGKIELVMRYGRPWEEGERESCKITLLSE